MELAQVFGDLDLALATYRHAVGAVIPELTRVAWNLKKDELAKADPSVSKRRFVYNLSRASYRKQWNEKLPGAWNRHADPFVSSFASCPRSGRSKHYRFNRRPRELPRSSRTASTARSTSIDISWPTKAPTASPWKTVDLDTGQPTRPAVPLGRRHLRQTHAPSRGNGCCRNRRRAPAQRPRFLPRSNSPTPPKIPERLEPDCIFATEPRGKIRATPRTE